ncbi:hypothetical protein [Streptomyces sp. NPDC088719]|uniref:hypothetical protein n=1 Tax=Streptomyces sp. NPDC088719 TaxID=3365872 RepID=UPI00382BE63C
MRPRGVLVPQCFSADRGALVLLVEFEQLKALVASGDSDGDGVPDLWTTTANTTAGLEFIPGRRNGLAGAPAVVGSGGWQPMKAIS